MKRKVFMVAHDSDTNKGGINSVMFSRTYLFNNEKYSSSIVTLDDKTNYLEIEQQLKEDGRLAAESEIINIYEYYRNKFTHGGINEEMRQHYEKNLQREEEGFHYSFEDEIARYFQNGRYVKFKRWDEDGRLLVVDYFSEMRVRIIREEYHPDGYLIKKTTFHPSNNKATQSHYYTKEGFCYLSRWFSHLTGKQLRVVLFSPDKQKAKAFENNLLFHSYFLDELCDLEETTPILICDGPSTVRKVQMMTPEKAVRIYTIHTNHLEAPYKLGSELKEDVAKIIENEDELAPIVVLTNRQKIDLETQFSERQWNLPVISHALHVQTESIKKTDNLIVVVGRFSEVKRLHLLIEAFKKTLEVVPDAKLQLYGDGPVKKDIQKQIRKLKLTKSISVKEYTTDAAQKLGKALFTVNTSEYEGQGLVMLEAMAQKTPTVAFNINYIVREVQDQTAGKVVPNGDVDQLAETMIDWLYNPEETKKLGEKAYETIKKYYTPKHQYELWDELFQKETARQKQLLKNTD